MSLLGEKLRKALDRIQGAKTIDREAVKETVKELQRALINSDVEIGAVLEMSKKIEEESFRELPKGITRREHIIKVLYDELSKTLGGDHKPVEKPEKILLVGLFGSGKTTTSSKLAKYYSKRGRKTLLVCADSFRPAAYEQLKQLSEKVNAGFYGEKGEKDAAKIVKNAMKKAEEYDTVMVDSAGRDALDQSLVEEVKGIQHELNAEHVWLVIGADMGQLAKKQATAFHDAVGVNGIIITRMDGSAKGGGALAACRATKAPVVFIGTGEKPQDLEEFEAERYLSRIMGYGDLKALLEKTKEIQEDMSVSPEELLEGKFTLKTFYEQLKAAKKIGPLGKIADMMGFGTQMPKEMLETGQEKLDSYKTIIDSMTKKEKESPETINKSRIQRIARGSGRKEQDIRDLLKQYKNMKQMMKEFKKMKDVKDIQDLQKGKMGKLMQKFGKKKKMKIR